MTTGGISNLHPELRRAENFQPRSITETFPIDTLHLIDIEKDATGRVLDKSVRKDEVKLDRLRRFGIIPEDIRIGKHCIVDEKRGDRFTELVGDSPAGFFIKLRNIEAVKQEPENISIVSGPCLFDVSSATANLVNGKNASLVAPDLDLTGLVDNFSVNEKITLYEAESIERLARFIGFLSRGNPKLRTVEINLPRVEYYLYGLDAFRNGSSINKDKALRWFDAVDARAEIIFSLFSRRITRYCNNGMKLERNEPLKILELYIQSMVSFGSVPDLGEMTATLKASGLMPNVIFSEEKIQDFRQLSHIGYMLAEIQPTVEPRTLVVAVENPPEEQILEGILKMERKYANLLSGNPVIGMYPFPQVIPRETKRNSLYWLEAPATLGNIKQVLAPYRKRK